VCEEQDGARSKMLQNEMWICCNLLSQTAVSVDEVCYVLACCYQLCFNSHCCQHHQAALAQCL